MQTLRLPLDARHAADQFWLRTTEACEEWLQAQGLASRDAVLLLPFAQHLAPARRAWMQRRTWPPRMETTTSLASSMGPSPLSQGLQISFDAAIDALNARQLLAGQSWAEALRLNDARAYQLALHHLVEAAQAFARHGQTHGPRERAGFWPKVRQTLQQAGGPADLERALALVALEWAASDSRVPATDALFDLRPSAWLVLRAGGSDPLSDALLLEAEQRGTPCLLLDADVSLEELQAPPARVYEALCTDREELAQCSAAAVLGHLANNETPVALIAQDRVLVRRVRALLERQAVRLGDETGWTLATTPEAAQLMALLRAAQPRAAVDEVLQWLKGELGRGVRDRADEGALERLEAQCRQQGWVLSSAVRPERLKADTARLWQEAQDQLAVLRAGAAQRSLMQWLEQLGRLLERLQAQTWLEAQAGGRQLLSALWLQRAPWPGSAHELALQAAQLTGIEFISWVNDTLEAQQFVPPLPPDLQVLITPMSRAMLRPFAAVVLPGADAHTLGAVPAGPVLLQDRWAKEWGMPDQSRRRAQLADGFVQLLRAPALTLLRCGLAGAEPLAPSPLLERLSAARARAGQGPLPAWRDPRRPRTEQVLPSCRAQAQAAGQLPARLSASGLDALRNCPYQFFAQQVLGLREEDELSEDLDKRDYGNWLHAVLHRFHLQRREMGLPANSEVLLEAAECERERMGLSEAEFLPYVASFRRLIPRYLAWLASHEEQGWQFHAGEEWRECRPWTAPALSALTLHGRLDRRDVQSGQCLLLDYKTGSAEGLKAKVKQAQEDTQLAVYALLCAEESSVQAAYLALDDSKGLQQITHPDVAQTAELLRQGLEQDLAELQAGAVLPALGEGRACSFCAARGLCRKDDWWEGSV